MAYQHTQTGPLAIITFAFFAVLAVIIYLGTGSGGDLLLFGVIMLVIIAIEVVFSRLTISVESGQVTAYFGWGWPHREFALTEIVSVDRVRNKWWYGLGLRKVPGGAWMFNVWGLDAVELNLRSGAKFRLGTNDIENLLAAISLNLGHS